MFLQKLIAIAIFSAIFVASLVAAVTPNQARAIAKEAYIYANPMVDAYRIQHAYFVDVNNPEYKAPWNTLYNVARLYTPEDTAVQAPNSDTPYSMIGLDLRTEPIVFTVPAMEKARYFSIQLVDAYTQNFDYIGSRTTGNGGGKYMLTGPNWKGKIPKGIDKVFRSETQLTIAIYRTQLFGADDLDNVKQIQSGYKAQPLSEYLGKNPPAAAPTIGFIKPLTPAEIKSSLEVFSQLNFILGFCPTVPSEKALMKRFALIGIGAGKTFDASALSPEIKTAMEQGIADGWAEFANLEKNKISTGKVTSGDLFGDRAYLKNNYLYRMAAAVLGIYGNTKIEAMYPFYMVDSDKNKLNGSSRYTLHFLPGQLPPVNAFWSLTMYEMPQSLLVANPLNRYLLNSTMLSQFKRDADGGLTFYIQNDSPGVDKESNWLPAPQGPFAMVMRLYWPKKEALNGTWQAPKAQITK